MEAGSAGRSRGGAAQTCQIAQPDTRGRGTTHLRSTLGDVLLRRVRRPAPGQTLSRQLDALEHGPLERLTRLVQTVVDELRDVRRRLDEQARDLGSLRRTVVELGARVDAAAAVAPPPEREPVAGGHVLLVSTGEGYRLLEREGAPPAAGAELRLEEARYEVLGLGASPLPGDRRPALLLLPG